MKKSLLVCLVLCSGCFQFGNDIPEDVLDQKEMAKVMTEIHILESRIYKLYLKQDSSKVLYNHFEALLLDSLNVSEEKFDRSLEYYFSHDVKGFQKVYQVVVDSLLSRQKRAKN
ncbi:MAG: DUF4296 domain-containing protein [Cyclobacteriaceae bacterium]